MATLAMIYGIIIKMNSEKNAKHHRAHVHAWYSGQEAVFDVETMEKIRAAVALTMTIVGIGSGVASGVGAYDAFKAGMSQADVSETEKYITALKQRLDECEEELNQILQMLQQAISQVAEMLSSATDTQTAIANNMGAMA